MLGLHTVISTVISVTVISSKTFIFFPLSKTTKLHVLVNNMKLVVILNFYFFHKHKHANLREKSIYVHASIMM